MILMQRLVTSSTQAIATAMERRSGSTASQGHQTTDEEPPENAVEEQDSQEQLDELLSIRLAGLANEKEEVRLLLDMARRCQAQGTGRTELSTARTSSMTTSGKRTTRN
jgi:hypothetical protein